MMKVPLDNVVALDQLDGRDADQALIESIQENGIVNPLKVYRYILPGHDGRTAEGKRYALLDGHRRLSAAQTLELEELPIEIMDKPADPEEARVTQVILNRGRKDIRPSHVAGSILMLKNSGKTQREIAKIFGMSEPEVSTYLSLQRGILKIKMAVNEGRISLSAVEPLLTKSIEVQEELADAAIRQRTVRAVRALVKTHEMRTDVTAPDSQLEEDIDPLEFLSLEAVKQVIDLLETAASLPIESVTIRRAMLLIVQDAQKRAENLADSLMGDDLPF